MAYELALKQFSGPLEKLLELIEAKKLEITTVSLAEITGDFLAFLKTSEAELSSLVVADFVSVATRLVLLKSKTLLPSLELTEEEEGDIKDLEDRLKLYQLFAGKKTDAVTELSAMMKLRRAWHKSYQLHSRPLFFMLQSQRIFYPPPSLTAPQLCQSLSSLMQRWKEWEPKVHAIKTKFVSIEKKINELIGRLEKASTTRMSDLAGDKSRSEMVATFLAVLHLLKGKAIIVEQKERFDDILITTNDQESVR